MFKKKPKIEVTKKFTFEAAHVLRIVNFTDEENTRCFGPCSRLHGHSYKLYVTVESTIKDDGMVVNFTDLSRIVESEIIDVLDHQFLNKVVGEEVPITCENLLIWIRKKLQPSLKELKCLKLYETEKCFATYNF